MENYDWLLDEPIEVTIESTEDFVRVGTKELEVGDKVRIKSIEWYIANKDSSGFVPVPCTFVPGMSKYCGKILTIKLKKPISFVLEGNIWEWSEEMFDLNMAEIRKLKEIDRSNPPYLCFVLDNGERLEYIVQVGFIKGTIFLWNTKGGNKRIFTVLGINNPRALYIELGIFQTDGECPYCKREDLGILLDHLIDKYGVQEGSKEILDPEWVWLLENI